MKKVKVDEFLFDEDLAKRYKHSLEISKEDPFIDMYGRIGIINEQQRRDIKIKEEKKLRKIINEELDKRLK